MSKSRVTWGALCAFALLSTVSGSALAAGPKVVSGPGVDPACFKPWTEKTKYFQFAKKPGPYRIALANGFIGNTWRIQMIKTAKAYAEQPEVKKDIKDFKVISTGQDLAAQIAAVDNFIDSGYDAVIINALNPTAFAPVIKRANKAGVVLVSFDNTLDSDDALAVNVDQSNMGKVWGDWLVKNIPSHKGKLLEVRGVPAIRSTATGTRGSTRSRTRRASVSRRSRWWAIGMTARPRRRWPTRSRCTSISTVSACRAARPAPCRR